MLSGAVFAAVIGTRLVRRELINQIQNQNRKVIAEQLGGKPTLASELELRTDGVWCARPELK